MKRIPFQNLESRLGWFPVFVIHHRAMFVPHIDSQRMFGNMFIPFWITNGDGVINLLRLMLIELHVEGAMRFRSARKDHDAGSGFIKAMNDKDFSIFFFKQFE